MEELLTDIETFVTCHEMREWTFGEAALGDRHFVRQLREGREPRRATVAKVRNFMASYRPDQQAAA